MQGGAGRVRKRERRGTRNNIREKKNKFKKTFSFITLHLTISMAGRNFEKI